MNSGTNNEKYLLEHKWNVATMQHSIYVMLLEVLFKFFERIVWVNPAEE